jgi:hypothetical protein|nr:MAG TPA_asm: RNA polymerase Rpc34 subunit [Caudoviricetes sp.]
MPDADGGRGREMRINEKIKTNGDRIRAMTDEELANFVATYIPCDFCWLRDDCSSDGNVTCYDNFLDWLRAPAESEGET